MEFTIAPANIDPTALSMMFKAIENIIAKQRGMIPLTQLLSILNFPPEINSKIMRARGPLKVLCKNETCTASNIGEKVEENLPGAGSMLGIIIKENFSCEFRIEVNDGKKTLTIDEIKGLYADPIGPFNPDVNKITVRMPNYVNLVI